MVKINKMDESLDGKSQGEEEVTNELRAQVVKNFQKAVVPNVNVPEYIVICLDQCYDEFDDNFTESGFRPIHVFKQMVEFFVQTKQSINKKTQFALMALKDNEADLVQNFTCNIRDILASIDYMNHEECGDTFDFSTVLEIVKQNIELPDYKPENNLLVPPYIVRLVVLYGRSNCVPLIPQKDPYLNYLKNHMYFYTDVLFMHKEDCNSNKCSDIYYVLQDLDTGYSYVFEISNAQVNNLRECMAKLLAHPLQRPLQLNSNYTFGSKFNPEVQQE